MQQTVIFHPLEDHVTLKGKHKLNWNKIHDTLVAMNDGENISFQEFLKKVALKEPDYILAVRSSIAARIVFLKRSLLEIRVNSYSAACLKAWRANMDLHNKFLNAIEISAQEASYLSLQLPLKKSPRQVIFINTSPPDQRVVLLKPQNQLESMNDDDDEIECKGLLSRYSEQPKSMENLSLAEFTSSYERRASSYISRAKSLCRNTKDGYLPETQQQEDEGNENYPHDTPHVFFSNKKVNEHNATIFQKIKSVKTTVKAKGRLVGNYKAEASTKILESFLNNSKDVSQLSTTLEVAEGLTYEMTLNLDCEDGLINGAACIVQKIKLTEIPYASGIIWGKFPSENTRNFLRQNKKHLYSKEILTSWTPIEPATRQFAAG
ncbi:unnamed protein product [Mytilus coruscus]|uniref:Uncharacterized protein n=1 Tax=Mytilus coruscus TaxID=42192 RepID=A0A6J8ATG1_MYTCO|nr:unnamed protein product [Mytilus coruscus]